MRRRLLGLLALGLGAGPGLARAEFPLAPHRAVYDMELVGAIAGSAVASVRGRYVFDFRAPSCAAFTLDTRLVTEIVDREGKLTLSDTSAASVERRDGGGLQFSSTQRVNRAAPETVTGIATRETGGDIAVALEKPERKSLELAAATMFPTQHSRAIIGAARRGETTLRTDFFDGSERGVKVYATAAVIGRASTAAPAAADAAGTLLDGVRSWPVSISYFEKASRGNEGLPAYELHFRLYENGVSRALTIDYGAFKLSGRLSALELVPAAPCPAP